MCATLLMGAEKVQLGTQEAISFISKQGIYDIYKFARYENMATKLHNNLFSYRIEILFKF